MHHLTTLDPASATSRGSNGESMQIDWESSYEPGDLVEAIDFDRRLLNELREHEDLPRVTSQISRHVAATQAKMEEESPIDLAENAAGSTISDKKEAISSRMVFTESDIEEFMNQPVREDEMHFVYDKTLCEKVYHRADYLKKLKAKLEHVALDCHMIEEITAYIKECKSQSNFDLSHEAEIAE